MCLNTVFRDLPLLLAKLGLITHVLQLRHNGPYVINKHGPSALLHTHGLLSELVEGSTNHFPGVAGVLYQTCRTRELQACVTLVAERGSLLFSNTRSVNF